MVEITTNLRDVPGISVGHYTDQEAKTGCTVILFDEPALTAVDVRGAAPGTRELDLLAPGRLVQRADAILLTGGSAFGLRAADGVVAQLAKRGRGFQTPTGPVPIVPAAVIYDLAVGQPLAPTSENGSQAVQNASKSAGLSDTSWGSVGTGTGASIGKISSQTMRSGGIAASQVHTGETSINAIVVLNAFGAPINSHPDPRFTALETMESPPLGQATSLISVIVNAPADHGTLQRCCVAAHDALARTIVPAHTMVDGDVAFASALQEGSVTPQLAMQLTLMTELAVEKAITSLTNPG